MTLVNSRRAITWWSCALGQVFFMLSAIVSCLLLAAEPLQPDAVVVAPREFLSALQPWVEHRQQQGHRLAYLANGGTAVEIRAGIRKAAAGGALRYVLIIGDAEPIARSRNATEGVPYSAVSARG